MSANQERDLFTPKDLEQACNDLSTLPFFPQEARSSVMIFLSKACPSRTALLWLVEEAVNHVSRWPGLAELRGLLCTRYTPADGIDHWCTLPGYTATEALNRHLEQHEQIKAQDRLGASAPWAKDLLQSAKLKSFPLPDASKDRGGAA